MIDCHITDICSDNKHIFRLHTASYHGIAQDNEPQILLKMEGPGSVGVWYLPASMKTQPQHPVIYYDRALKLLKRADPTSKMRSTGIHVDNLLGQQVLQHCPVAVHEGVHLSATTNLLREATGEQSSPRWHTTTQKLNLVPKLVKQYQ